MRALNEIIVHCAATPEGRHVDVATIDEWHKARGWKEIGYHFVIYLDGSTHKGRAMSKIGAHVRGHNTGTIGICYVGGVARDGKTPKDTRTPKQKAALVVLMRELVEKYPTIKKISGHNQYAAKACPSFNAGLEYRYITSDAAPVIVPKPDDRYAYLQRLLTAAGYDCGLCDGIKGDRTLATVKRFQEDNDISPADGSFNTATVALLRKRIEGLQSPGVVALAEKVAAKDRLSKEKIIATIGVGSAVTGGVKELSENTSGVFESLG